MKALRLFILFFLFVNCSSQPLKNPTNSSYGYWETPSPHDSDEIILVPQWHYSPGIKTREIKVVLPQDKNQFAIYAELRTWIQDGFIKNIVVEGCEGDLKKNPNLRFNDWSLNDLRSQENSESIQTHIGLKLLNQLPNSVNVECGDDLALIKEHQLALSDIRGLAGYKVRIEQSNLPAKNKAIFLEGAKENLKLPKNASTETVLKKLNDELEVSLQKFEALIGQRNEAFLQKAQALNGRKVIVIGALHIEDLKKKLTAQKKNFSVWRPLGVEDNEGKLIDQLRQQLRLPAGNADLISIFENFWKTAKENIYPLRLEKKFFTNSEYQKLRRKAQKSKDLPQLSAEINKFLARLKISHTHFYNENDLDFYFFRSLFTTRLPDEPSLWHIGAQFQKTSIGFVVQSVLDGYPAQKAGVKRGDVIISVNALPFDPIQSFKMADGTNMILLVRRQKKDVALNITPVWGGLHRAFLNGIKNSIAEFQINGKKIGYVHLWTGTHDQSWDELAQATEKMKDTDALILDLRDGYGGAWWNHLDPFFKNTQNYFKATWIERDGKKTLIEAEPKEHLNYYAKPMVVLINEGVRSGKEALAFQFKKSKRAKLIGTTTAGFFVGGGAYFRESDLPFFLYLSSKGLLLDNVDIEGKGVKPDIVVTWPFSQNISEDPQLKKAKEVAFSLIKN